MGDEGLTVAAADGLIRVQRVRPEGGGKIAAGQFASGAGLKPGSRLGA